MLPAVISLSEAVDLFGVVGFVTLVSLGWSRLRRRETAKLVARKEKQAEYKLAAIRRQREWDEAQRYFGTGVR